MTTIPRRLALLALSLSLLPAAAGAVEVSVPLGPAYDAVEGQIAARNGDRFAPAVREWKDRGLRFTDEVSNLREPDNDPVSIIIVVRREADKKKAVAAARKVLGRAADAPFADGRNVATIQEYFQYVVDRLKDLNHAAGEPITVDFGAVRRRLERDLKGVTGAAYIVRSPDPS